MYTAMIVHTNEQLSDSTLIEQALLGDQSAFEVLVSRYETVLYNFVKRCLGDYEQAWDVVQFVFLQLYRFLPRLQGNLFSAHSKAPLKSWLFQVAVNRCRQERRKNQPLSFSDLGTLPGENEISMVQSIADPKPLPDELAEQHELQNDLYAAIQALPARSRSVVLLRYNEELSFSEIGRRLDMPEN
nr:sigma-70 family RNA polymerase sigma factor [Ktedonobacteraceae bacterium]